MRRLNLFVGLGIVALLIITAVLAPWLAPFHPTEFADLNNAGLPPKYPFLLGTDEQGRDVLSRVLYGARISLMVGLVVQSMK